MSGSAPPYSRSQRSRATPPMRSLTVTCTNGTPLGACCAASSVGLSDRIAPHIGPGSVVCEAKRASAGVYSRTLRARFTSGSARNRSLNAASRTLANSM